MIENIYSARIIYSADQTLPAFFVKEFWKFCGVYVREFIAEEQERDGQEVCVNIWMIPAEPQLNLKSREEIYLDDVRNDLKYSTIKERKESCGILLPKMFTGINKDKWKEALRSLLEEKMRKVFTEHDYAYQNCLVHLYLEQLKAERKDTAMKKLIKCYNGLYAACTGGMYDRYLKFAYLNCARKINRICLSCGVMRIFRDEKLMEEAAALTEEDEAFSMGNALAGMIGLGHRANWLSGEAYLKRAIQTEERRERYSAFLYYCLGHFYEAECQNGEKAWMQYAKMLEYTSYRAEFKMGCHFFYMGKYNAAGQKFAGIYKRMKNRETQLQPLEAEYYDKCARLLCEKYFGRALEMAGLKITEEDSQRIRKEAFSNSVFQKELFGRQLKQVQDCFQRKMQGHSFASIVRI